jgi:Flagellar assembly protein FliH
LPIGCQERAALVKEVRIKLPARVRNVVPMRPGEVLPLYTPVRAEPRVNPKPASVEIRPDPTAQLQLAKQMSADREFIEKSLKELGDGLRQLYDLQQKQLGELRQAAVELAVLMAGRLLLRDLEEERFDIETMVRDMSSQMVDDQPVAIRLNPNDIQLLENRLANRPLFPDREWTPKIVPDATVTRGGCVVEGKLQSLVNDPASELLKLRDETLERMTHARS